MHRKCASIAPNENGRKCAGSQGPGEHSTGASTQGHDNVKESAKRVSPIRSRLRHATSSARTRPGVALAPAPFAPHTLVVPRKTAKTVRLDPEDVKALKRAEADGVSPSELVRRSLRVAAARYYRNVRRPPNVTLLVSTDPLLGEESELYEDFRE